MAEAPRVDWRRLRGGNTRALPERERPPFLERRSTSEGDMARGSYRESGYDDHFTRAVANDDGSPITYIVEGILIDILEVQRDILAELQAQRTESKE